MDWWLIFLKVLELYNKVLLTKQKQVQEAKENEDFDKATFTNVLKEFEGQTDSLLKQQQKLQRELNELNNVWMVYYLFCWMI